MAQKMASVTSSRTLQWERLARAAPLAPVVLAVPVGSGALVLLMHNPLRLAGRPPWLPDGWLGHGPTKKGPVHGCSGSLQARLK